MILEVDNLYKKIGKKEILHGISFNVGENEIVGIIGPNGSGKSTTLKCIASLYFPTSGQIKLAGYDVVKERAKALSALGISIEAPALYPDLSGHDHFKIVAAWHGLGKERIKEMEKFSGINELSLKQKVNHYSMGMKQRLILSLSMMANPRLLILDEPTNGLDPQAIFELREKLLEIKRNGSSILFSSHQLSEMEKVIDRAVFIKDGRLIDEITIDQLSKLNHRYQMSFKDIKKAEAVLAEIDYVKVMEQFGSDVILEVESEEQFASLMMKLSEKQVMVLSIKQCQMDLEDYYKKLYGGK